MTLPTSPSCILHDDGNIVTDPKEISDSPLLLIKYLNKGGIMQVMKTMLNSYHLVTPIPWQYGDMEICAIIQKIKHQQRCWSKQHPPYFPKAYT